MIADSIGECSNTRGETAADGVRLEGMVRVSARKVHWEHVSSDADLPRFLERAANFVNGNPALCATPCRLRIVARRRADGIASKSANYIFQPLVVLVDPTSAVALGGALAVAAGKPVAISALKVPVSRGCFQADLVRSYTWSVENAEALIEGVSASIAGAWAGARPFMVTPDDRILEGSDGCGLRLRVECLSDGEVTGYDIYTLAGSAAGPAFQLINTVGKMK